MTVKSRGAKPRRIEHAEQTRRALLRVARRLFAKHGFAATPIDDVVRQARVTKGALYHHFRDKRALFEAVVEVLQEEQLDQIRDGVSSIEDPWKRFLSGSAIYLDNCLRPDVQRIVLLEAPSVLGWDAWRELDARYARGAIRRGVEELMSSGILRPYAVDLLTNLLIGILAEAALAIARAEDPKAARAEAEQLIGRMLSALRASGGIRR